MGDAVHPNPDAVRDGMRQRCRAALGKVCGAVGSAVAGSVWRGVNTVFMLPSGGGCKRCKQVWTQFQRMTQREAEEKNGKKLAYNLVKFEGVRTCTYKLDRNSTIQLVSPTYLLGTHPNCQLACIPLGNEPIAVLQYSPSRIRANIRLFVHALP